MNQWLFWRWFAHPVDDFGNEVDPDRFRRTMDQRLYFFAPTYWYRNEGWSQE